MLRVGVIGAGYWGPNLIRNFASIDDVSLEQVADINKAALEKIKADYPGVRTTLDPHELLASDVDAVCIATSAPTHYELTREALLQGKHVLCEKPLTLKSEEAQELVQLADERNLTLMVGHLMLYHPAIRKIKELIDSGKLGDLLYVNSIRVNLGIARSNENVLWSLTPHDLSMILYLFDNEMPLGLSAAGQDFLTPGIEDIVFVSLFFAANRLGHVRASWLDPTKIRRLKVAGSKGMIVFDDVGADSTLKFYDEWIEPKGDGGFEHHRNFTPHVYEIEKAEPLRLECEHFVQCVLEGKKPLTDGRNGLAVVTILERAQASLKEKGAYKSL